MFAHLHFQHANLILVWMRDGRGNISSRSFCLVPGHPFYVLFLLLFSYTSFCVPYSHLPLFFFIKSCRHVETYLYIWQGGGELAKTGLILTASYQVEVPHRSNKARGEVHGSGVIFLYFFSYIYFFFLLYLHAFLGILRASTM